MIDLHLWHESLLSGLVGKEMAQEAIRKTGKPINNVYVIIIEDDYPKLSSFCVIPNEAFGWGIAAKHETNYQWPEMIKDTTIERSSSANIKARELANRQLKDNLFDCIWRQDLHEVYYGRCGEYYCRYYNHVCFLQCVSYELLGVFSLKLLLWQHMQFYIK